MQKNPEIRIIRGRTLNQPDAQYDIKCLNLLQGKTISEWAGQEL